MKGNGRQGWRRLALLIILLLTGAYFLLRGPARVLHIDGDLTVVYTGTRVWLHGHDPYNDQLLEAEFARSSGTPMELNEAPGPANAVVSPAPPLSITGSLPCQSPPSAFVLLAPLGLLSWHAAKVVWAVVNLISLALAYVGLVRLMQPSATRNRASQEGSLPRAADIETNLADPPGWPACDAATRAMLLAVLVLGLAPVQTSIALGQLTLPVMALVVWGMLADRNRRGAGFLAGVLFAIAACLKPQMGAAYLAYLLLRGRWRPVLVGAVVGSALMAAGIVRMELAGVQGLDSMRAMYAAAMSGGVDDFAGTFRYQLLQLQYPLFALTGSRVAASAITWGITGILGALLLWFSRLIRTDRQELLAMGIVTTLCLLCVYHRYYDAAIILIPAAWALASHPPRIKGYAKWCLVLIVPFVLPGGPMLHALGEHLPGWVESSWWWQGLVVPHQTWLVLGLAIVLTAALAQTIRLPNEGRTLYAGGVGGQP